VDDCSTDRTPAVLREFEAAKAGRPRETLMWRFLRHDRNGGKGKAIQTALEAATCEISVIHDADLEYNPRDLLRLVQVFIDEPADVVFGSRFAGSEVRRVLFYRHQLGNKFLTTFCNLVTNLNLTDMETCYKAVRTDLLKSIPIVSNDFRLEPELTIKLAKRRARIFEVPISYSGRTYQEGKKIGWRDGVRAVGAILRFALSDEIYKKDEHGSQILARLSRAPRFNAWMADVIRPYCGSRVLEIGGGVGNLTLELVPRWRFVVSDINPLYLQTLNSLRHQRPYLDVQYCDVTDITTFRRPPEGFDTAICLNVIEHIEDDEGALRNIGSVLAADGRAVILVPQGPGNFGSLDEVLGHHRRYTKATLTRLAEDAGFRVEHLFEFNRVGTLAWFINGRLLRRRSFSLPQIKLLNWLVPIMRPLDAVLPTPPLSLIAILQPAAPAATGPAHGDTSRPPPGVAVPLTCCAATTSVARRSWGR
jgi:SAM-dependent methyltransferase